MSISIIFIVIILLAILYIPIFIWVWRSPKAAELGLSIRGPIVMYRTQRGQKLMERIGSHHRMCAVFAVVSNMISIVLMAVMVFFVANAAINLPKAFAGSSTAAVSTIASSGLNLTHLIIFGIIALVVSMIIHEFAHGIQSKANGIRVESAGVMYAVVPLGAFVEMNEEDTEKASLRSRMSVYSAGISTNFVAAVVSFFIFAVLMLGSLGMAAGVSDNSAGVNAVIDGSLADDAGIPAGAIITEIDGVPVSVVEYNGYFVLSEELDYGGAPHTVTYVTENGEHETPLVLGAYISFVSPGSPADSAGLPSGSIIDSIVSGAETYNIYGVRDFRDFITNSEPGQVVTINYTVDGSTEYKTLTLGDNNGIGYIGVGISYSGLNFISPGYVMGKAADPTFGSTGLIDGAISTINYPFISFNGFSPIPEQFQWWFDAPGGDMFWIFAALFYWMFWINLLLGITNALPAVPFDGGFLLKGWITQLLEKVNYKDQKARESVAGNVTRAVSGFMIFILILAIVAIIF